MEAAVVTKGVTIARREIGRVVGRAPGPTLVVVAGIHGNEPAGITSARRVLERLAAGDLAIRGELVVLAGNLAGLREGVRYHAKDLNRVWSEANVAAVRARPEAERDPEDREQLELLAAVEEAVARARGRVHLADLHTSSAPGIPFVLFGDTLPQRRFVRAFPIPVLLGLEEQIDNVLAEYWTRRGCVTFSVEGGQHDDPASRDSLEAVIWLALAQADMIRGASVEPVEVSRARRHLDARRAGLPRVLEVVERRAISVEDCFAMEPGFKNIHRARAGQLLARDRHGEIRAPEDGVVILPLYQKLGSDGFFWGRPVSRAQLRATEVLRRLQLDRLLRALPGVRPHGSSPSKLVVASTPATRYALDLFRLFGYRRVRPQGSHLTVERQPE